MRSGTGYRRTGRGRLILFDNVVIPFVDKYPTDTKTYVIMNTRLEENVKQEETEGESEVVQDRS